MNGPWMNIGALGKRGLRCAVLGLISPVAVLGQSSGLAPLTGPEGSAPNPPWVFAGLPGQTLPVTRFTLDRQGAESVLRVQAQASYGNLIHRLPGTMATRLSWRWRVELPLASADLRTRSGDDVALKVCALFDMPRQAVPFLERQLLRVAEARTGERLPNATLCYAWDTAWPEGSVIANAHSARVRYITLGQTGAAWQWVQRDLAADFLRAFGDEHPTVPPLLAIGIGADADNTQGRSLGYVADLVLQAAPVR